MRKYNKGYPYKEKKKPRIIGNIDRRPHLSISGPRPSWKYEAPKVFDIRNIECLIDMWMGIIQFNIEKHKLIRIIRKLFKKQNGLCAVTGAVLTNDNIGIDIIRYDSSKKIDNNLRLVIAKFAFLRARYPSARTCSIDEFKITKDKFEMMPIGCTITFIFHEYLCENNPFKGLPIYITQWTNQDMSKMKIKFYNVNVSICSEYTPLEMLKYKWPTAFNSHFIARTSKYSIERSLIMEIIYNEGDQFITIHKYNNLKMDSNNCFKVQLYDPDVNIGSQISKLVISDFWEYVSETYQGLSGV